jgi:hypothetical protein
MDQELFEPHHRSPNPFHPLDSVGCYALLDAMSEDELLEYGSNPMDAYAIVNQAFAIKG